MPEIYLDDNKLDVSGKNLDSTVGELCALLGTQLEGLGRAIMGVETDGESRDFSKAGEMSSQLLGNFREIKFTSAPVSELTDMGIDTVQGYVDMILWETEEAHKMLLSGSGDTVKAVMSILDHMNEMVKTADAVLRTPGFDPSRLFNEDPKVLFTSFLGYMETLKNALTVMDTVVIADTLNYEMIPAFKKIKRSAGGDVKDTGKKKK